MNRYYKAAVLLTIAIVAQCTQPATKAFAQYPAKCDSEKVCVGNALTFAITSGKLAQYVDVDTSSRLDNLGSALTFEAWISPQQQPGKIQYIAGLWGPNQDNNDQWVLYIQDNKIVFELSKDNSYKGDSDNTIAIANVPNLYTNGWRHVAAVWDAQSTAARIYVDGVFQVSATNPIYPLNVLHVPENSVLPVQIGGCNGLYDDTAVRRTFLGQIDEVRLWSRALSATEIACQRLISLNGNEPGLELYYRCNESPAMQFLCDATGNNHIGLLRSGALCDTSNRTVPLTYSSLPSFVTATLTCTEDTDLTFTLIDSSLCGDNVDLALYGPDKDLFTLSTKSITLTQNVPVTFTVHLHTDLIGPVSAGIAIANGNSCGDPLDIALNINRVTQLSYSLDRIQLDTLYVGCQQTIFSEKTITICNPGPGPVTLNKITLDSNHFILKTAGITFPDILAVGDCVTITIHMDILDTSKTLLDTLRVFSNELCPGSGLIPIMGRVQDVLGILQTDGKSRLDSMDFGTVCPGFLSNTVSFEYRALGNDTVYVDSMVYSPINFFGAGFQLPMNLPPFKANQPTYARFKPDKPGPFVGTLKVYASYHGCDIIKSVALTGAGYSVNVDFLSQQVSFGNVTIGKTAAQSAMITDSGTDQRNIDSYLHIGDVFTIIAGGSYQINPGQTEPITLQFRPRQPQTYYDTLCIFDEGCYETKCIPVEGTGVFDAFSFTPPYLDITNVVGCSAGSGTITMKNILSTSITITNCVLTDPTGKFSLANPIAPGTFAPNQTYTFNITYTPNDVLFDRADEAYIDVTLSDGEVYHIILRGTSNAPRLYVTPVTAYGIVEVGWQSQDSILLQNASDVYEHISSVTLPYGYTLVSSNPTLPCTLPPRDSIWLLVKFQPTNDSDYTGNFAVQVDSPCVNTYTGELTGSGQTVKLDVPISFMNFGLVRPCDCAEREIPLANYSNYVPITIDSIWIDGQGVTLLTPPTFHWLRQSTRNQSLPIVLPPLSFDTIVVSFCPNIPATNANLVKDDTIHILAHTQEWSSAFSTFLSGRREMNFQPNITLVQFPATRVDTSAQPMPVTINVPGVATNPDGDSVVIDNVSFQPDQNVFSAVASNGAPLPWIIKRNKNFTIKVNFFPRAPKIYTARMLIHTIFPCNSTDTSVLVMGSGFAPAFGLQMAFDTTKIGRDTIRLTTCDTLVLPIMSTRDIPQEYMDVYFHLGYDTTELQFLGGSSAYTNSVTGADTSDGVNIVMNNGVYIKSGAIDTLRFKVIGGPKIFPITLDDINFDSDSLVFFEIIAGIDHGVVEIDEPMISVSKLTDFDTVNVRDCENETVTVSNTGIIPVRFDSLSGLPQWHKVTASSVPLPAMLQPGDSLQLTVTFCPRAEELFDTTITAFSNQPCLAIDTGTLHSYGYAPPFPFKMSMSPDVAASDSISGLIADTVEVPIIISRAIPLTPLDVRFSLTYNPRALEFLSVTSPYAQGIVTSNLDSINFVFPECQNIVPDTFALVKFLMTVPDSVISLMILTPGIFTSDSIMFIKPVPVGDTSIVSVGPQCNITRLVFVGGANSISAPNPNPTSGIVAVDVSFVGDANPQLDVLNATGEKVLQPLDGKIAYKSGSYHIEFDSRQLAAGAYYLIFRAGDYRAVEQFVVIR